MASNISKSNSKADVVLGSYVKMAYIFRSQIIVLALINYTTVCRCAKPSFAISKFVKTLEIIKFLIIYLHYINGHVQHTV